MLRQCRYIYSLDWQSSIRYLTCSVILLCTARKKWKITTGDSSISMADTGIKMNQLIAFKLFIGDYRFSPLQQILLECIETPNSKEKLSSVYQWRVSLQAALDKLYDIRRSLGLEGIVSFDREMSLLHVLDSIFGSTH